MGKSTISMVIFNSYGKLPESSWGFWTSQIFVGDEIYWNILKSWVMWRIYGHLQTNHVFLILRTAGIERFHHINEANSCWFWWDHCYWSVPRCGEWEHGGCRTATSWSSRFRSVFPLSLGLSCGHGFVIAKTGWFLGDLTKSLKQYWLVVEPYPFEKDESQLGVGSIIPNIWKNKSHVPNQQPD